MKKISLFQTWRILISPGKNYLAIYVLFFSIEVIRFPVREIFLSLSDDIVNVDFL